jgi:hypothetical protein
VVEVRIMTDVRLEEREREETRVENYLLPFLEEISLWQREIDVSGTSDAGKGEDGRAG